MDEVSGALAMPVSVLLNAPQFLTPKMIAALRAYFRQWICSPAWDMNPAADDESRAELAALRAGVDGLTTVEAIHKWLMAATDFGVDPL